MGGDSRGPTSDEKWRALVDGWPGSIVTIDGDNYITSLNRSTEVLNAYSDPTRAAIPRDSSTGSGTPER